MQLAESLRAEAEARMRRHLYIDSQPQEGLPLLEDAQLRRVLCLVAAEVPTEHLPVMRKIVAEFRKIHTFALKKAVFEYKYQDPVERQRLQALGLPAPAEAAEPPLKGTVRLPGHPFEAARAYIAENLFFTHHILYHTLYVIMNKWLPFGSSLLVDTELAELSLPCALEDFRRHQMQFTESAVDRLRTDWAASVANNVQADLEPQFNFYEGQCNAAAFIHPLLCVLVESGARARPTS